MFTDDTLLNSAGVCVKHNAQGPMHPTQGPYPAHKQLLKEENQEEL